MDLFSVWHWLIVGAVLLVLFGGRGKMSDLMGDVAKGIKAFKSGIADPTEAERATDAPSRTNDHQLAARDKHPVR